MTPQEEEYLHFAHIGNAKYAFPVQNVIYGTEELANIDAIIDLIEQTLDKLYVEAKRLEAALPLSSEQN